MTTIDLIRHADVHNPRDVFYGRLPRFGLSDLGRRQAARVAERLAPLPIQAVYTSPMLRARQTATILATRHPAVPPVVVSRLLIEIGSHWQGRPTAELDAIGFDFFSHARDGDESIVQVFARMERLIRRLARQLGGRHVVCVSHADPIMIARVGFTGRPLTVASLRGQPDYPAKGSISRFEFTRPTASPTVRYLPPEPVAP